MMYDEDYVSKLRTKLRLLEDSNRELTKRLKDERKNSKQAIKDLKSENEELKADKEHLEEELRDEIADRNTNYIRVDNCSCECCEPDYL